MTWLTNLILSVVVGGCLLGAAVMMLGAWWVGV
jgi:hypothetical protein